jgi:hypothetical protein
LCSIGGRIEGADSKSAAARFNGVCCRQHTDDEIIRGYIFFTEKYTKREKEE